MVLLYGMMLITWGYIKMGRSSGNRKRPTGIGFDERLRAKIEKSNISYVNFMDLYNLAVGRFEWIIPEDIKYLSTKVLEESAIINGSVLFFKNEIMGLVALPSANSGTFDINNIPKVRNVSRANGFHAQLSYRNSVLMYNDDTHVSFIPIIEYYSDLMTEIDLTIRQNLKLQRRAKAIVTDSDNENSVKKMLENNSEYLYPYLLLNESILRGTDGAKSAYTLDLGMPFIADKLRVEKDMLRTEYLTRLGINNTRYEKKERMTNDEIAVNNEEINSYRYTALKCRLEACDQIKDMFGIELKVRYATEEKNNGIVHDNITGNNLSVNTKSKPTTENTGS